MIRYLLHPIQSARRLAELETRLDHLAINLRDDAQWLAHDDKCKALTRRYMLMTSDNWRQVPFERPDTLRKQLGLCPWTQFHPEPSLQDQDKGAR